jgi:hypothetical protein
MSKTTLRKRISVIAVSALTAGMLSVVATPVANAGIQASSNAAASDTTFNVAVGSNATGAAVLDGGTSAMRSLGLLDKDASSTTAQTATVLSTGAIVFYAGASGTTTSSAMVASGGTFTASRSTTNATATYSSSLKSIAFGDATTTVAASWSPAGVGTYTVSYYRSTATTQSVTSTFTTRGTLIGTVLVTVVAASSANAWSSGDSTCTVAPNSIVAASLDDTSSTVTNGSWFINYNAVDAYGTALPAGAFIASATNGALVNFGAATSTPVAGSASTVVDSTSTGAS